MPRLYPVSQKINRVVVGGVAERILPDGILKQVHVEGFVLQDNLQPLADNVFNRISVAEVLKRRFDLLIVNPRHKLVLVMKVIIKRRRR